MHKLKFAIIFLSVLIGCDKLVRDNPRDPASNNYSQPLVLAMSDTSVATLEEVRFSAKALDSRKEIDCFLWSFDSGATFDTTTKGTVAKTFEIENAGEILVIVHAMNSEKVRSVPDTIIVHITTPNSPVISPIADKEINVNEKFSVLVNASDPNGTVVGYQWSLDTGKTWNDYKNGEFSKTWKESEAGKHIVWVRVVDNDGLMSAVTTFNVTVKMSMPIPLDSLLAYYPFNGNARDKSGNGHHGTVNGASLTTDRFNRANNAYNFDGNDYISVPDHPDFTFGAKPFSLSLWISLSQIGSYYILGHDEGGGTRAKWIFWFTGTALGLHERLNGGYWAINTPWQPQIQKWYHIVLKRDHNRFSIYVNTVQVGTQDDNRSLPDVKAPFTIGTAEGTGRMFNGKIDDVRIYKYALSDTEIQQLFKEGGNYEPLEMPKIQAVASVLTSIEVKWSSISGATRYLLETSEADSGPFKPLYSGSDTSFIHKGLKKNQKVYYRIKASNSNNESEWSKVINVTAGAFPTEGLVAYYPFNGNANDESGNGNDGAVNGAILTNDRFNRDNNAYFFDGVDDYINIGKNIKPKFPISVSLWIKIDSQSNQTGVVFRNDYINNKSTYNGIGIYVNSSGKVETLFGNGNISGSNSRNGKHTDSSLTKGEWHHVVVSFNGKNDVNIYFNSIEVSGTYSGNASSLHYSSKSGAIGCDSRIVYYFLGSIDDIRVYNKTLLREEIKFLFEEDGYHPPLQKPILQPFSSDSTRIEVKWPSISGATRYLLQTSKAASGPFKQLYSGSDTSFSHKGLKKNQKVYYRIKASNSDKESEWSKVINVTATAFPTEGLVAYYPFNGNANDESGNEHHGTVSGAILTSDRFGNPKAAYDFDGSNDNISSSPTLPISNEPRSISVWFNTTSSSGGNGWNVNSIVSWGSPSNNRLCAVQVYVKSLMFGGFGTSYDVRSGNIVNDGKWHHVAVTYDGLILKIFLDNVEVASANRKLNTSNSRFYIGRRAGQGNQFMDGSVDDVRIYNRAITIGEIKQLFQEGEHQQPSQKPSIKGFGSDS